MHVEIRPGGQGDAPALALVGQATFLESYAGLLPAGDILAHCESQHSRGFYEQALQAPGRRLWLAEAAPTRAPVGYAMIAPPDLPIATGPDDIELKRIYLLSRFHRSGVGARLMEAVLQAARGAGAKRLLLGVYGGNERAIDFYARQGFTRAGVRKFRVGANTYDDLVLARSL